MKAILLVVTVLCAVGASAAPRLKIQGSTTVNPVVVEASEAFKKQGWTVFVDTQGGSSGGIAALGEGLVDIGMVSRPVNDGDRKKFPKVDFKTHTIGYDGVALAVSRPVYDGGAKAVDKAQIAGIYEGRIKNWKEVGGPDKPIVFFNKEPGRGTWEVFVDYVYGKADKAPAVTHPEVGGNEETRSKVASHPSAITQLSASWVEGNDKVRALAIRVDGKDVPPTLDNIRSGAYPMRRSLSLVTNGEPKGPVKEFLAYLTSDEGQKLLKKHGYLPLKNLP